MLVSVGSKIQFVRPAMKSVACSKTSSYIMVLSSSFE